MDDLDALYDQLDAYADSIRAKDRLIEQQAKDLAALRSDIEAQVRIAIEEAARASGLERDAARYRWLRRQAVAVKNYASGNPNWEIDWALRGESFDAAIDAALAQGKEG
ncbi:MAG TPA: hypothetical protein VMT67_11440 [Terriglobales bacterium]|nr:hypothetical protein [Terriglobales bacterium]